MKNKERNILILKIIVLFAIYTYALGCVGVYGEDTKVVMIKYLISFFKYFIIVFGYFLVIFIPLRINSQLKKRQKEMHEYATEKRLRELQEKENMLQNKIFESFIKEEDNL